MSERIYLRLHWSSLLQALMLPLVALALQWVLWPWLSPFVWFLFYPAVFFGARLGGLVGGLAASVLSASLVWFCFLPPALHWTGKGTAGLYSVWLFLALGFVVSLLDESLRRKLRGSETRLRTLIDHAPASMAMFDRNMRYLAASGRWREEYQLGGIDLMGRSHYEIFPEITAAWKEVHARGMRGEVVLAEEDRFERQDGSVQYLRWEVRPWRDGGGVVGGIAIFTEDITQRLRDLDALRESEARYRSLFQGNHAVMLIINPENGVIEDANPAAARFYGWTVAELRSMRITQINTLPPDEVAERLNRTREEGAKEHLFQHRRADGSIRDVEVFSGTIRVASRLLVYTIIHDITDRLMAEEATRASRAKLAAALQSMQDAVFISDTEGRFLEFNDAFASFHRFKDKAECARTFAEYPDLLDVALPDGTLVPVERWAVPRALRGETVAGAEYGLLRKDTGERWVGSYNFGPIRDAAGAIVGSVVVARDITAAKHQEALILGLNASLEQRVVERTAELQAAHAEVESFAYAVSHDLRAPLRAMSGFSQALVEDLGPRLAKDERESLDEIIRASARMSGLIDGILKLSRITRGELERSWVDLSALARQVRRDLEEAHPGREVVWDLAEGLRAWGDARLLEAVLLNLLGNAWKFTARANPARITLRGGPRRFEVEDNGAGFDQAYAAKLFEPFQRLHRQDEFPGLGIGLATVQRIIRRHGGTLEAHSEPGCGARFTFTLPGPELPD